MRVHSATPSAGVSNEENTLTSTAGAECESDWLAQGRGKHSTDAKSLKLDHRNRCVASNNAKSNTTGPSNRIKLFYLNVSLLFRAEIDLLVETFEFQRYRLAIGSVLTHIRPPASGSVSWPPCWLASASAASVLLSARVSSCRCSGACTARATLALAALRSVCRSRSESSCDRNLCSEREADQTCDASDHPCSSTSSDVASRRPFRALADRISLPRWSTIPFAQAPPR
jgi:hypothetical protein